MKRIGKDMREKIFKEQIEEAKTIAICSHVSPDGDALGSSLGLGLCLEAMGKEVIYIKNDDYPKNFMFLKQKELLKDQAPRPVDLFIVTDVAAESRIGDGLEFFKLAKNSLCIDHHRTNSGFCKHNIIDPDASSTCQLVSELLVENKMDIPKDAATMLYLGMVTDTNRFLYESTESKTLRLAAHLIDQGAEKQLIHNSLYESTNKDYLLLEGEVLSQTKYICGNKISISTLSLDQLEKYKLSQAETDPLVSVLKSIEGVEVSCLIKENAEDFQKVSLRSKEDIDVSKIALEFGGGGHIRASGFPLEGLNRQEAMEIMTERLEKLCDGKGNIISK